MRKNFSWVGGVFRGATIGLCFLRATGVIRWNWLVVLAPLWVPLAALILLMIAARVLGIDIDEKD